MREIEKTITYALNPQDVAGTILEDEVIRQERNGWHAENLPRRSEMKFDANYNTYYTTVTYKREYMK